jgi:hypothetical protein
MDRKEVTEEAIANIARIAATRIDRQTIRFILLEEISKVWRNGYSHGRTDGHAFMEEQQKKVIIKPGITVDCVTTGPIVELDPTTFEKLVTVRINTGGTHFEDVPATVTVEKEADNVFKININDSINAKFEAEKNRARAMIEHIEKMQAAHNAR